MVRDLSWPRLPAVAFAASVPLQNGPNRITAVVFNPAGAYGEASISINTALPAEEVTLTANPSSGVLDPTTGTVAVTLRAEVALLNAVAQYQWDVDGDGLIDQTGPSLIEVTANYQMVGLYSPKVMVIDTQGHTYTATAVVNVMSLQELDTLLKSKWEGMKAALSSGNIDAAMDYFTPDSRSRYRPIFESLGTGLPQIIAGLPPLELIDVGSEGAEYLISRVQQGQNRLYIIEFGRDAQGFWRIQSF